MTLASLQMILVRLSVLSLSLTVPSLFAVSAGVPTLSIDAAAARVPISPDIYGIANYGLDPTFAEEIQVGNVRWGGDGTSRYNWQVDSSNAGFDWYFMGGSGATTPPVPGASPDLMINTYKPAKANALITIPILPYVNKSYAWSCSFPVSQYGAQTSTNPYVFPVVNGVTETCGNSTASVASNGSTQLIDNTILANHISNTAALQQGWVQHLITTFGTAAAGGVKYYQLDNEPLGWSNTHRDVQPSTPTYATIAQLGQTYAAAIKQVDSAALVLGPSDFTLGGWVGTSSQQGGLWAGQYYLQQMAAYEQTNHVRVLDYFDEHYYFDTSSPTAQLAATRTLWDPTYNGGTWVEQFDFNGPMQLIPRFKNWITTYYPGTKLSLSEYSIDSGQKSIVDALAEMDVLGIYGREQLDFANMWNPPAPADPIAYAFRMYRNYDGKGHMFGDTSVSALSSDQGSLSVYAAQRSSDAAITILAINKTTASITTAIALANIGLPPTAQVYVYSDANLAAILQSSAALIAAGSVSYTFPSYSAVLFVVQPSVASTTTTMTASATELAVGSPLTLNVAVSAAGTVPSGTVSLTDGSTSLGTLVLANAAASLSTSALSAGTHTLTATYAGNSLDSASSSSRVVKVDAAPLATTTVLAISPDTTVAGQTVVLTATVTPATGSNAPTGTVTFQDGGMSVGSASLAAGTAVLSLTSLSIGTHTVTAHYAGDVSDLASTSVSQSITISASSPPPAATPDYSVGLSETTLTMSAAGSAGMMVSMTPQNGFTGTLSFACSGLPAGWDCSFAPPTLSAATAQTTVLTVRATTSGLNASHSSDVLLAVISPYSLMLLGLYGGKRRSRQLLGFVLAVSVISGCGGDSAKQATAPSSTPAASYTVTVTASGVSLPTHTAQFDLTVTES